MISDPTLSLIRSFKDPIINLFGGAKDELIQLLDNGLSTYIESYRTKFLDSKNFLFRNTKVPFSNYYYPISLRPPDGKAFKVNTIESLYSCGTCISIIGKAGSGKSVLLKYIFLQCIEQQVKIPLFIELKALNEYGGNLEAYISSKILNYNLSPSSRIVERLLASGKFFFLFDGFDEIYTSKKNKISHDIEDFMDRYIHNWYLITSRPGAGVESLPRFSNNFVQPLAEDEIYDFITQQCEIIAKNDLSTRIISLLQNNDGWNYKIYLSNPLMLSMFLFTFRIHPYLPKKKSRFYWNIFDTLLTKHDSFSKKGGWQHEKKSSLDNDQIELILKWFSYFAFVDERYIFSKKYLKSVLTQIKGFLEIEFVTEDLIYDLEVNVGILHADGESFTFPHRSMQEYFSAALISDLDDNEIKQEIYKSTVSEYVSGVMYNYNFLELLTELDYYYLYDSVIIPKLKQLTTRLEVSPDFQHFDTLTSVQDVSIEISYINENNPEFRFSTPLGWTINFLYEIIPSMPLSLLESIISSKVSNLMGRQDVRDYVLNNCSPVYNSLRIRGHKEYFYPLFDQLDLNSSVLQFREHLESFIQKYTVDKSSKYSNLKKLLKTRRKDDNRLQ